MLTIFCPHSHSKPWWTSEESKKSCQGKLENSWPKPIEGGEKQSVEMAGIVIKQSKVCEISLRTLRNRSHCSAALRIQICKLFHQLKENQQDFLSSFKYLRYRLWISESKSFP